MTLRVGLTGGIASGKSQVSQLFSTCGVEVIDADKIARDLFKAGSPLLLKLKQRFGESIFQSNGELNRKALGKIVFNSNEDLAWLNQLTHPLVSQEISRQIPQVDSAYVIIDIPLLVDRSGGIPEHLKPLIDRILVIDLNEETQRRRLCQRDKITLDEAKAIIENQSSRKQKLTHADDILDNNGTFDELESQVELLHNHYLSLAK